MERKYVKNLGETNIWKRGHWSYILISVLILFASCTNQNKCTEYLSTEDFTEEESKWIIQNDAIFKHGLKTIRALHDSIKNAHLEDDHDKAATAQFELMFVWDKLWDSLANELYTNAALSHEFDSMEYWFPMEDSILKRHYFVEE